MVEIKTGYFPDDLKMYTMRIVEGEPLGNFWGPKFLGFDDKGGAVYEDLDGVEGITEADYQVIGNAYPDVLFSLSSTFTYKHFSLSFLLRGSIGNDVLNQSRVYYEGFGYFGTRNVLRSTLDYPDYKGSAYYSSRFVEDGSYLKLDNLTLGYDFDLKSRVGFEAAALRYGTESLYDYRLQGYRSGGESFGTSARYRLVRFLPADPYLCSGGQSRLLIRSLFKMFIVP